MRFVETRLRTIMDILKSNNNAATFLLYSKKNNMDSETRDKILQTIETMLNEIRHVRDEFGLEQEVESLKRKIDVNLDEIWTTLLDTRPEKMRGRGMMLHTNDKVYNSSHVT